MKLYDKKFLIYGNCMIRSFGQPGHLINFYSSLRFACYVITYSEYF